MTRKLPLFVAASLSAFIAASGAQAFDNLRTYEQNAGRSYQTAALVDPTIARDYPQNTRVLVRDPTEQAPGTITVDTKNRYLYLSLANGEAVRYDVGVGREGFEWKGRAKVARKAAWPSWTPPAEMLKRRPDLPRHMVGGPENPLGARAMYLYAGGRDTLYRIHGTSEPWTIGEAVSSGCIRMLNDDVIDLYSRVRIGAQVQVL
ncbi:MAG: L,D-transpeptidase [Hyphomicrobiales bacterium]|nr:L,D-transpeptidase [Hyphomicrobiales bacterium]